MLQTFNLLSALRRKNKSLAAIPLNILAISKDRNKNINLLNFYKNVFCFYCFREKVKTLS